MQRNPAPGCSLHGPGSLLRFHVTFPFNWYPPSTWPYGKLDTELLSCACH